MSAVAADRYRQFRVPQESGKALIDPPLERVRGCLHALNVDATFGGLEFCGQPISVVRREARREVVELARRYTSNYRDVPNRLGPSDATPIILSGHQPELYHPGVWFKNFLLSQLAAESGSIAINFLVDNDLCRSTTIRVPTRAADGTILASSVAFDAPRDSIPWEHRSTEAMRNVGGSSQLSFAKHWYLKSIRRSLLTFGSMRQSLSRALAGSGTQSLRLDIDWKVS